MSSLRVYLLEPFLGGSHARWAEGWRARSRHRIEVIGLPARHWKWRMHGAAVTFARQLADRESPDLIVATDMLDVATFRALARPKVPILLYCHENQLTYPWSPDDKDPALQRDRHYGWINYTSALAADGIAFNSHYHRRSFLAALPPFLRAFPDAREMHTIETIERKSVVLPLALDLPPLPHRRRREDNRPPVLVWNHRWEYDKNPAAFFRLCEQLEAHGQNFQLIVLGEHTQKTPVVFRSARDRFGDRILHWGYATDRAAYWQWLQRGDLLPVTSRQDFFGGSAVEGIHAGLTPLLPRRLAFPEHLPDEELQRRYYYDSDEELLEKTLAILEERTQKFDPQTLKNTVARYDWRRRLSAYDDWLDHTTLL